MTIRYPICGRYSTETVFIKGQSFIVVTTLNAEKKKKIIEPTNKVPQESFLLWLLMHHQGDHKYICIVIIINS